MLPYAAFICRLSFARRSNAHAVRGRAGSGTGFAEGRQRAYKILRGRSRGRESPSGMNRGEGVVESPKASNAARDGSFRGLPGACSAQVGVVAGRVHEACQQRHVTLPLPSAEVVCGHRSSTVCTLTLTIRYRIDARGCGAYSSALCSTRQVTAYGGLLTVRREGGPWNAK